MTQFCTSQTTSTIARRFHANWPTHNWSRLCPCESPSSKQVTAWRECSHFDITKNAPYAWGNSHACAFTSFQKPQQLGRVWIACSSIVTSRAQWAEPDLNGQRCCKLRLKLLLVAKKTWKLIVEFVTTKRLVCKNGHSLVEPPSRVFYTVSVSACLFVGNRFFQKVYGPRSRRPHHLHFSHGSQNRRLSFCRCRTVREEVGI